MHRAELQHIAIEVESLTALKNVYAHAKVRSVQISFALNHGCSLSLYVHDPEGNLLEIFWATGIKTHQPIAEPIQPAELERPEQELLDLIGASPDNRRPALAPTQKNRTDRRQRANT